MSLVLCCVSSVRCHMSGVIKNTYIFLFIFFTDCWYQSVEGLLSTGPTPSSLFKSSLKITQPLRKKIMQPLRTKKISCKITQPLARKNHSTSQDKKITQPPGTKKITQPLGTKKSCNLSRQKSHTLNRSNCGL